MAQREELTSYAAQRAKLLLGCYRTGEANDPETYVAAVTAVLARYPEEVITTVTHPVTGLPKKIGWLPTIKEVGEACDAAVEPIRQNEARLKRIKEQMEMRERERRGERPSLEQMQEKYGKDWGIKADPEPKRKSFKVLSWDEITAIYAADPSRLARLIPRINEGTDAQ
jgi:hypothetical protein